jgi:transcriptional antiterminator NusG
MSMRWYVVHAYSGFEKSVQRALLERIQRQGMQEAFGRILVPVEEVVELKMGQKSISERKFFPGYVLVEMEMNDDSWHLVKSTPKVTGFVGGTANKPTPISEKEVAKIMQQMQGRRRQAASEGSLRARRSGSRQGRAVHRFSWCS